MHTWQTRLLVSSIALALAGIAMGIAGAPYLPRWIYFPVLLLGVIAIVVHGWLVKAYIREEQRRAAESRAHQDSMKASRREATKILRELTELREKMRRDLNLKITEVFEVGPDGELMPIDHPGATALMMDQVADQLRQEALRRAAEEQGP